MFWESGTNFPKVPNGNFRCYSSGKALENILIISQKNFGTTHVHDSYRISDHMMHGSRILNLLMLMLYFLY